MNYIHVCKYCFQWNQEGRTTCYLGIIPANTSVWILGSSFIAKYYTVFRYKNDTAKVAFVDKSVDREN